MRDCCKSNRQGEKGMKQGFVKVAAVKWMKQQRLERRLSYFRSCA